MSFQRLGYYLSVFIVVLRSQVGSNIRNCFIGLKYIVIICEQIEIYGIVLGIYFLNNFVSDVTMRALWVLSVLLVDFKNINRLTAIKTIYLLVLGILKIYFCIQICIKSINIVFRQFN